MGIDSSPTKCPGQDTKFWKPDDIFDVECGECGRVVEFFKDDASRRCDKCGNRIKNPKLNLGCAQWCEHAKECLGYDPKEQQEEDAEGATLVDELIGAMKKEFGDDQKRISHALSVLDYAEQIMKEEGGEPRIVLAAAVLHDIGIQEAERKHESSSAKYQEIEGPPIAERILKELGFDTQSIYDVCEIVGNHHSAKCNITLEFKVVWDADLIVNIPDLFENRSAQELDEKIEKLFRTDTGKKIAKKLYIEKREDQ